MIKHVDYIWNTTSFPTLNKNNIIDTGIFAESDCEIRVAYQGAGASVDRIVGFSQESTAGDNDDFRIFYHSNGSFDWGTRRVSNLGGFTSNGVDYDITMGNGWLYNNLTSSYIYQENTATYNHNCTIRVDVGGQKVKSLQIKNGGVVAFDAFAALDDSNNTIGLYDTVSNTMLTNTALTLTYGQIVNTFEISPETMEFPFSGGSSALTITAEDGWTASTNDSWITLSSTSGTGNSSITVTASENATFQAKSGAVTVTDGNNTLTCSISQNKHPKTAISNGFYLEDTRINKMYLNGALIYQNMFALVFDIDTTEVEMEYTGGTFAVEITANKPWSLTAPEWVSASTVSGKSSATVTFTVGENSGDTERVGNISVNCNNVTKQINVTQKTQKTEIDMYLTFEVLTNGEIKWARYSSAPTTSIDYRINNGSWVNMTTTSTNAFTINVNSGDKIEFKGTNAGFGSRYDRFHSFNGTTAKFNAYGNIMSIIDENNFSTLTTFTQNYEMNNLFYTVPVVDASRLIFPVEVLYPYSYKGMFLNATELTKSPKILATTMTNSYCANQMFNGCTNLSQVYCMATSVNGTNTTSNWLNGVATTGTFIKNANMSGWQTGASGIPTGWTVINAG